MKSRDGMAQTVETSPYYPAWVQDAEAEIPRATAAHRRARPRGAGRARRSATPGGCTPRRSPRIRRSATCSRHAGPHPRAARGPPRGVPVWFTLDAGPNPVLLTPASHESEVERLAREAGARWTWCAAARVGTPGSSSPERTVEVCLSAPGKLFLSGEYAVLWGGIARLLGVGPRAFALARNREDRGVHLVLAEGRLQGTVTPLGVRWATAPGAPFAFAARALDVVVRARARESLGLELALSSTAPGPGGHKLGLGSSARAVVLAVESAARLLEVPAALALSLLAHAEAQGGKGSGGDVATCAVGGLLATADGPGSGSPPRPRSGWGSPQPAPRTWCGSARRRCRRATPSAARAPRPGG